MSEKPAKSLPFTADSMAADALKSMVERIERIHEERKELADDVAAIYAEAKSNGYETAALRYVIRRRANEAKNPDRYRELQAIAETYMLALGMKP
jgi:uncharacterized protein (UPF0335 family)